MAVLGSPDGGVQRTKRAPGQQGPGLVKKGAGEQGGGWYLGTWWKVKGRGSADEAVEVGVAGPGPQFRTVLSCRHGLQCWAVQFRPAWGSEDTGHSLPGTAGCALVMRHCVF